MQAKKPAKPYAPKSDGSSYCQLVGGTWHGLWFRMYPIPGYKTGEVKEVQQGLLRDVSREFDDHIDIGAERYVRRSLSEQDDRYAAWRQVRYVAEHREDLI